ncbi:MAG: hypothetical protein ABSF35_21470 [Polyangia bacterium]|jgi:hypothetical protein
MDLTEQLRVLQTAQGDPARLVLATVDLKYPKLAEAEREMLKETLEAAAIPHWCTEAILAALLQISANLWENLGDSFLDSKGSILSQPCAVQTKLKSYSMTCDGPFAENTRP